MRLRRITLRHYRGIEECTVALPGRGVTIVSGPNEIGKTSLAEALDLLFDHLDSSKKRSVLAVKPVHLDEGAEIEADVEAGGYRFTYFKRFHKRPETRLTVTAPTPENHTGREAHERVRAILAETVDMALWRALRIDQGTALSLPGIGDNPSLSKALDAVAGAARADDGALTLFERARAEFERYFTATGREKKDVTQHAAVVSDAERQEAATVDALRRLEHDVERAAALVTETASLDRQLAADELAAAAAGDELRALERRQSDAERREAEREAAAARVVGAERDHEARIALVARVADAAKALAAATAEAERSDPAGTCAKAALDAAAQVLDAAVAADSAAAAVLALRESDHEFRRAELDHAQLGERLARVIAADEAAASAEEILATSRVDDEALRALREAQRAADAARIRAEAGSPEVTVLAERDVTVQCGDATSTVAAGNSETQAALEELVVEAPGIVRVTVRPPGDAATLRSAMRKADDALAALLARCGVDDIPAAESAHAMRQEAERALARRKEIVSENLRDLTRDTIERKVRRLAARVASYTSERTPVPGAEDVPDDFDASQEALATARAARQTAAAALDDARRAHETARTDVERLELAAAGLRERLEAAGRDAARAADELARAREDVADDALAARREELAKLAAAADELARAAREELAAARPDDVRARHAAAAAAALATRTSLRAAQDETLAVRTRLQQSGQEGLAERRDEIQTKLVHARRRLASTRRRAAAARLLFETLAAKRDAARQAYVKPLRDRIVRLGQLVFDDTFDVELGDDLAITQRTLGGRTVPFDGLSGGAKEQLDLITRAAAAMVVSADEGVPLILDDALGYSDPSRLAALGAVLSMVGELCQVIILTCMPDRYRHVSGAHTIRLA